MDIFKGDGKISRKLIAVILAALLMGLNDALDLGLTPETLDRIMYLVLGYNAAQGAVDAAGSLGKDKATVEANGHGDPPATPPPPPPTP